MIQEYYTTKHEKSKHLTIIERAQIELLLEQKVKKTDIAKIIGISRSTLYEELKRGTVLQRKTDLTEYKKYFAETGQLVYEQNRKSSRNPYKYAECIDFIQHVDEQIINNKLSPDAICGIAKKENLFKNTVCPKTIYNYIDLGLMRAKNIDLALKVRLKTKTKRDKKNKKILGNSIDTRPEYINNREEMGHWEIDTVIGRKNSSPVLLTLDERVTRQLITVKIASKTAEAVNEAIRKIIDSYGENAKLVFKSITADNGSEFSSLSEAVKGTTDVYFTHPYSSYERGTNEKQNSLIRRFFPKKSNFTNVSEEAIHAVQEWINNLPRKILNYSCSNERFSEFVNNLKKCPI